jgi:hypothetical protein
MDGGRQCIESSKKSGRRRVQIFIANTVGAASPNRASSLPVALGHDFFQWDAVARSAPGRNPYLRIHAGNLFGGYLLPGRA